jgi:hypothetical protein
VYEAELQGAFVFGPDLPVTLEGQDERLINDDPITIGRLITPDEYDTWNDVFEVCGLLQSVSAFTASGGKKGWRIARPGGVYVQFPIPTLPSNYGDVKVTLQLLGDCSYSSTEGETDCDPFPPVPGENGIGISKIPLTRFNIHAKGEKNILHSLDVCHSESDYLETASMLVITATELQP